MLQCSNAVANTHLRCGHPAPLRVIVRKEGFVTFKTDNRISRATANLPLRDKVSNVLLTLRRGVVAQCYPKTQCFSKTLRELAKVV